MSCVVLKMKYTLFADDGSFIETVLLGEAMDTGDKAINKAMAIAYKYLCFQVFCIPVEDMEDPDGERPELAREEQKENNKPASKRKSGKEDKKPEQGVIPEEDSLPMTETMHKTLLAEMERTGVPEKLILARKQMKDKKRKSIQEFDISDFKYVMEIFEKTADKPKEEQHE